MTASFFFVIRLRYLCIPSLNYTWACPRTHEQVVVRRVLTAGVSQTTHPHAFLNYHGITFQNEVVRTVFTVVPRSFQETCGSTMHGWIRSEQCREESSVGSEQKEQDAVLPIGGSERRGRNRYGEEWCGRGGEWSGDGRAWVKTGLHYCYTVQGEKGIGTRPAKDMRTRNGRRNNKTKDI